MNQQAIVRFLQRVEQNAELRAEFTALAQRYGIDVASAELSDDDLGRVSGGLLGASSEGLGSQSAMQQLQDSMAAASSKAQQNNDLLRSLLSPPGR